MKQPTSLRYTLSLLAVLVAFIGQASLAHAGTLGNIAGTVRDASTGAPVAGARIEITSGSQAVATTTDAKGHFVVFSLQPDDYTLTAEKPGYATRSVAGYSVFADQTQQYDLEMTPASNTSG
jgi:Carboxypeptidase regulatory-like domain